ncbi:glycosyltransferase family A protein [Wenyingzhuangia marina]|uniref:Glycosyltransferase involved in cell wall bisynthesis n=1 Tax=Wenyingzhuangia marina TaxID=1195760 RepID=A0A1M5U9U6_9FLAO|nr:glycosyltransferase family 2 protein [Wenyingzhuangia marina]GGF68768.1 glycosyl transferase [Wenyingzhuangia marina]SHH59825.1 Glycosyltransferase involved in cell wall bisynthesis [Wenyingzhuangia marina]
MLAILIPYYKKDFFQETFDSLLNQTCHKFNVYIGDDCSPYNFESEINKETLPFNLTYKRYHENLGGQSLVKHWNRCLTILNDEKWFMILGDDDVLQNNFVDEFYKNVKEVNAKAINVVRYASVKTDIALSPMINTVEVAEIENTITFFINRLKGLTRSTLSEFVFKVDAYKKHGFKEYPLAWHTDVMAVLEFSEFNKIYGINTSVVKVRSSGINISSMSNNLVKKNEASFAFFFDLLNIHNKYFTLEQLELVYFKLEKTFLDNKKKNSYWRKTILLYIKNKQWIRLLNFIGKYLSAIRKAQK